MTAGAPAASKLITDHTNLFDVGGFRSFCKAPAMTPWPCLVSNTAADAATTGAVEDGGTVAQDGTVAAPDSDEPIVTNAMKILLQKVA
jgi:hypothetical protein